jgi:hypothetical protein
MMHGSTNIKEEVSFNGMQNGIYQTPFFYTFPPDDDPFSGGKFSVFVQKQIMFLK